MKIPRELRELVYDCVRVLGAALKKTYGEAIYQEIEDLRHEMKRVRGRKGPIVQKALESFFERAKHDSLARLKKKAKAFSLMLELINVCEASYRTHRLNGQSLCPKAGPKRMAFVFTSHPTEARSEVFLFYMDKIAELLKLALLEGIHTVERELFFLLTLALQGPLANTKKPKVTDEASSICHTVLRKEIINEQLRLRACGISAFFETWSGGDKDGHPMVGSETLKKSLELSREKLLQYIDQHLKEFCEDVASLKWGPQNEKVMRLKSHLKRAKKIRANDGALMKEIRSLVKELAPLSPQFEKIYWLFEFYPGLVMPLEIREDQRLIHLAQQRPDLHIAGMLKLIKEISRGGSVLWYVKSLVISMCQESDDILAALRLIEGVWGNCELPVVPLFENERGLTNACEILAGAFNQYPLKTLHQKKFKGQFEVMLGYSDSTKESGALPGRLMVEKAAAAIENFLIKSRLVPIFFHGSGGSTSRGGGTIKEQLSWLPKSSVNFYKATIQGEMVQRQFQGPLIMRSHVRKIVEECDQWKSTKTDHSDVVWKFKESVQKKYKDLLSDERFLRLVKMATPYDYLNHLKIGSRPNKRGGGEKLSVRAIPWALCWTQTRLFLPFWWGLGSSFLELNTHERARLKKEFMTSPILLSFIKNLGFTLAKIEPGVWSFHLEHSGLNALEKQHWQRAIKKELEGTMSFFSAMTGNKEWLWFRPWLAESIYFRSSMIHPLNVIQKIALLKKDYVLLRETVTGISCGMLTTG